MQLLEKYSFHMLWTILMLISVLRIRGIEYIFCALSGMFVLILVSKIRIARASLPIYFFAMGLVVAMILGLVTNINMNAIRQIIFMCIIVVLFLYGELLDELKCDLYFYVSYLLMCIANIIRLYVLEMSIEENVLAGQLLFLFMLFNLLFLLKKKQLEKIDKIIICGNILLGLALLYQTKSRTALLVLAFAFLLTMIVLKIKLSKKVYRCIFWVVFIGCIVMIFIYMYVTKLPFYDSINKMSLKAFDKNIDSARSYLWLSQLQRIKHGWMMGCGTGTLPDLFRYQSSSYHNSYIQLLVQNGVIGCFFLIMLLWSWWKSFEEYRNDWFIRLVNVYFICIIIYNCFETTLIANKFSIAIIEWLILMMGRIRISKQQKNENERQYEKE